MIRIATILACTAAMAAPHAALAQGGAAAQAAGAEVIRIEVAPEDLDRCRETLSQVMAAPVEAEGVTPAATGALPQAVCVAVQA